LKIIIEVIYPCSPGSFGLLGPGWDGGWEGKGATMARTMLLLEYQTTTTKKKTKIDEGLKHVHKYFLEGP